MRRLSMSLARWFATDRRAQNPTIAATRGRSRRGRRLLRAVVPHAPAHVKVHTPAPPTPGATVSAPVVNPVLRPYRVFVATITQGKDAGTTIEGPIVLGYSGESSSSAISTRRAGGEPMPSGRKPVAGSSSRSTSPPAVRSRRRVSGQLQGVRGGLPGGDSLLGQGHFYGPVSGDQGTWATFLPSKVGGLIGHL